VTRRPKPGDEREVVQQAGFFAGLYLGCTETALAFRCPVCGKVIAWWASEEGPNPPGVELVRRTGEEVCEDCREFLDAELDELAEAMCQRIMWNLRLAGVIR
jgi:hypothetical protein